MPSSPRGRGPGRSAKRKPSRVAKAKRTASTKTKPKAKPKPAGFPQALASLLRKRGLRVPPGLMAAPPEAYAAAPAEFVETLARLEDSDLVAHSEKVAGYARRQAERAKATWDTSPLILEIRRRKLKEPLRPGRVVALAFSLKRPLSEWSNRELLRAAAEWSRRGRRG